MLRRIGGALRWIGADRLAFDVTGIAREQLLDRLGRGNVGHSLGRRIGGGSINPRQRDGDYKCSGKNATMSHRFSPTQASGNLNEFDSSLRYASMAPLTHTRACRLTRSKHQAKCDRAELRSLRRAHSERSERLMMLTVRIPVLMPAILVMLALPGCMQDQIDATQKLVTQQQAELEQLQQEVAALQSQRGPYSTAPTPPGACDVTVMRVASKKGGERFAASDFGHALGYYQDAVTACSTSAQALLNVARTYEAMGDHGNALGYYRRAANVTGPNAEPDAVRQAREALNRLGASG